MVQVTGAPVQPAVTQEMLVPMFGRISSFTTETTNDSNRNTNISLSADALNGKVVMPGETLSFNESTGQRTTEKGYKEAGAISGGQLIDDTGGGVCQTSSTLFNGGCTRGLGDCRALAAHMAQQLCAARRGRGGGLAAAGLRLPQQH